MSEPEYLYKNPAISFFLVFRRIGRPECFVKPTYHRLNYWWDFWVDGKCPACVRLTEGFGLQLGETMCSGLGTTLMGGLQGQCTHKVYPQQSIFCERVVHRRYVNVIVLEGI